MIETGLVQIYCGDGKGKTTAAIGAAVRAAGRGYRVLVARLLKTDDSGDEAIGACNLGFVDESGLIKALKEKPASLEVILTGRCPSEALQEQADYITEMVMRRHPYERGIGAREGIEY